MQGEAHDFCMQYRAASATGWNGQLQHGEESSSAGLWIGQMPQVFHYLLISQVQ
jgi:hypothetical protein